MSSNLESHLKAIKAYAQIPPWNALWSQTKDGKGDAHVSFEVTSFG